MRLQLILNAANHIILSSVGQLNLARKGLITATGSFSITRVLIRSFYIKTHAEAELGIIIGKQCKNIAREDWLSVVAGFTTTLDMTAMDIPRKNLHLVV